MGRFPISAGCVVVACLVACVFAPRWNMTAAADENAKDDPVRALLREKRDALEAIAEIVNKHYESGLAGVTFEDIYCANREVRESELELCTSASQRIDVLRKMREEAADYEKFFAADHNALPGDQLRAKVNRLEIEILLERAKATASD